MCRYSNNLYNVALYNIRQYYFHEKKFLKYEENYHVCKENENYGLLQAGISQQTLKVADRSFKSFFNLIKKAKKGEYRFKDIRMPHYRKKGGMFNLVLSTNAINIKDGFLTVPMSREFSKLHPGCQIRIPFPERLEEKTIKEVRICPVYNGRYFKIQYKTFLRTIFSLSTSVLRIWQPASPIPGHRSLWTVVSSNQSTSIGTSRKPDFKA